MRITTIFCCLLLSVAHGVSVKRLRNLPLYALPLITSATGERVGYFNENEIANANDNACNMQLNVGENYVVVHQDYLNPEHMRCGDSVEIQGESGKTVVGTVADVLTDPNFDLLVTPKMFVELTADKSLDRGFIDLENVDWEYTEEEHKDEHKDEHKEEHKEEQKTSAVSQTQPSQSAPPPMNKETPNNNESPGGISFTSGKATWYYPGLGSCGKTHGNGDMIAAISQATMEKYANGQNSNNHPFCGKTVKVTVESGENKGKSVIVQAWDTCPGCSEGSIDLSPAAFNQLAHQDVGLLDISMTILDASPKFKRHINRQKKGHMMI